jgi:hypothetical protein
MQAKLSSARDILLRQPIVVCPFDHAACKEEMEAIEQAAKDAAHVSADNPLLPPVKVIRANDPEGLSWAIAHQDECNNTHEGQVYEDRAHKA